MKSTKSINSNEQYQRFINSYNIANQKLQYIESTALQDNTKMSLEGLYSARDIYNSSSNTAGNNNNNNNNTDQLIIESKYKNIKNTLFQDNLAHLTNELTRDYKNIPCYSYNDKNQLPIINSERSMDYSEKSSVTNRSEISSTSRQFKEINNNYQSEKVRKMLEEHRRKKNIAQRPNGDKENLAEYANNFGLDDGQNKNNNKLRPYESYNLEKFTENKQSFSQQNENIKSINNKETNSDVFNIKTTHISKNERGPSKDSYIPLIDRDLGPFRNLLVNTTNQQYGPIVATKIRNKNTHNMVNKSGDEGFRNIQEENSVNTHDLHANNNNSLQLRGGDKLNQDKDLANTLPITNTFNKSNHLENQHLGSTIGLNSLNSPIMNETERTKNGSKYIPLDNRYNIFSKNKTSHISNQLDSEKKINNTSESKQQNDRADGLYSTRCCLPINSTSPKHIFVKLSEENVNSNKVAAVKNDSEERSINNVGKATKTVIKTNDHPSSSESLHWQIRQIKELANQMKLIRASQEKNGSLLKESTYDSGNKLLNNVNDIKSQQEGSYRLDVKVNASYIQEFDGSLAKMDSNSKLIENDKSIILDGRKQSIDRQSDLKSRKSSLSSSKRGRSFSQSKKNQMKYYEKKEGTLQKIKDLDLQFRIDSQKKSTYIMNTYTPNHGKSIMEDNQGQGPQDSAKINESKISKYSSNPRYSPIPSYSDLNRSITLRKMNLSKLDKDDNMSNILNMDRLIYSSRNNLSIDNINNANKKAWSELSVYDRNSIWLNAKTSKILSLQKQLDHEEIKECTFKPYFRTKSSSCSMIWSPANSTMKEKINLSASKNRLTSRSMILGQSRARRSKSLCYKKKENMSYSKFHELKRNLNFFKNNNDKTNNSINNTFRQHKHQMLSFDSFDTIKISDVLNTVRNSKQELLIPQFVL